MLLVGSFEPFDEAEARRDGADDYLTKPFQSIRALVGKVRDLLSGGSSSSDGSNEAVTRKLALPPEADKENFLDEEAIQRSTADTAPLHDHEHEETRRAMSARETSFNDLSMDDQMIEATPANDYSTTNQHERETHEARPTAAYSTADLKEAGISQALESEDSHAPEVSSSAAYAPAQSAEPSPMAAASHSPSASRGARVPSSDDALLDLGDIEPSPAAMTEADDFFLDLLDETPAQTKSSAPVFTETRQPPVDVATMPSTAEDMDAHARADYEAATFEAAPQAQQLAPTERLQDDFQADKAPAETGGGESVGAASVPPVTGQITLAQLSPEVIDAIARRAVEQLSERVVEQIAWEVVPDLAELLIKRRLEEGKQ
jgi:CheY-like chemotaxis protein